MAPHYKTYAILLKLIKGLIFIDYFLRRVYQFRFKTEIICLLVNLSVTSYFRSSSDILRCVENLKFRKHAESATFIEIIAC